MFVRPVRLVLVAPRSRVRVSKKREILIRYACGHTGFVRKRWARGPAGRPTANGRAGGDNWWRQLGATPSGQPRRGPSARRRGQWGVRKRHPRGACATAQQMTTTTVTARGCMYRTHAASTQRVIQPHGHGATPLPPLPLPPPHLGPHHHRCNAAARASSHTLKPHTRAALPLPATNALVPATTPPRVAATSSRTLPRLAKGASHRRRRPLWRRAAQARPAGDTPHIHPATGGGRSLPPPRLGGKCGGAARATSDGPPRPPAPAHRP